MYGKAVGLAATAIPLHTISRMSIVGSMETGDSYTA